MEKSGLDLLTITELKSLIRRRLKTGWIILLGNAHLINIIETTVYPPRTEENKLFEAVMSPALPTFHIFLAKKTDKLANFLGNPPDLDKTICLEIMERVDEDKLVAIQTWAKKMPPNEAINLLIKRLGIK